MSVRASFGARVVGVLVVAGFVLVGAGAGASTRSAETPQKGGTFTLLKGNDQGNGWDPIKFLGVPTSGETPGQFAFYDALFYVDPASQKLVPRLGLSLTSSDGGTTWTVKLRPNVKFSDGTTFDATAVQFNWARIADPANKALAAASASVIQSMDVVDPLTLKVTLKSPNPNWDQLVATKLAWIASPTALKADPVNYGNKPVGAGPFLLKEWIRDSQYTLVRNPNYWEKGRPYLDTVILKIITDATAAYNTFRSGAANALVLFDPAVINQAQQDGYKLTYSSMNAGGWGMAMNNTKPPFTDLRVRKAMDLAIDRRQFNQIRRGSDKTALMTTLEKPGSPFYDAKITVPKYDLPAAQKLIDQVVAETGKPVTFTLTVFNADYLQQDAQVVQAQLQKLKNVSVSLEVLASATVVSKRGAGDFQAVFELERWNEPSTDFVNYYKTGSAENFSRYSNPTVDAKLTQLLTATDQKTRVQLVQSAEEQILKDSPVVWWTRYASAQVLDKTLRDYVQYFDQIALLDNVWIAKGKQ